MVSVARVHMHACLGPAGEVCKHQEASERQPAWLLGETLMYEELSTGKRLFNNLSIKL